jgi:hypothetical protein
MSALPILNRLRHAGLTVTRSGDKIIVAPKERITDELRAAIRQAKPLLLKALTADLEERIRVMARRWGYSPEELAAALAGAQSDHAPWLAWTLRDERDFGHCATPEDFAEAYRRARGLE